MYVYSELSDYIKLYPGKQDDLLENHLCAFLINEKNLIILSKNKKDVAKYKPDFSKSIVYFDGGEEEFSKYEPNFEYVTEVKYDLKKNMIKFEGTKFNHDFVCARYIGDKKLKNHVKGYILYDESRNRLNLIMKHATS